MGGVLTEDIEVAGVMEAGNEDSEEVISERLIVNDAKDNVKVSEDVLNQENGLLNVGNQSGVGEVIAGEFEADGATLGEVVVEHVVERSRCTQIT